MCETDRILVRRGGKETNERTMKREERLKGMEWERRRDQDLNR